MSEKRFGYGADVEWRGDIIIDYETEKSYDFYEVGKLLNELSEENKQLKEEIKGFESCSHNWGLLYDEAKNKVEELSKENKELKHENVNIMSDLDYYLLKSRSCEEGLFEKNREIAKLEKENKEFKQLIKKVMDERVVDYPLLCKIKEMVK